MKTTRNAIQRAGKCMFLAFVIILTPSAVFANRYDGELDKCYLEQMKVMVEGRYLVWGSSVEEYCKCAINATRWDTCPATKGFLEEDINNAAAQHDNSGSNINERPEKALRREHPNYSGSGSGSTIHFHVPLTTTPNYMPIPYTPDFLSPNFLLP